MTATVVTPRGAGRFNRLGSFVRRHATIAWLLILTLAVLLLYASSLQYPFFWVDPIDIGLARDRTLQQIFTTSQGYLYYRPFTFVLWKLLDALSGRFDPFAFHLVQVVTHVVNVWLMFALAKRLLNKTLAAGVAALFFAWYPFSYQTVTWVISPQPQATLFMLASAILYFDGRTGRPSLNVTPHLPVGAGVASRSAAKQSPAHSSRLLRREPRKKHARQAEASRNDDRRKIWLSVLMLAIALPFQENAVSFGFVIAALEGLIILRMPHPPASSPKNKRRFVGMGLGVKWYPLLHISVCLAFAVLWLSIPKDPDSTVARFEPATGWYLLQGLIWPAAGAVGPWRAWFPALSNPAWQPLTIVTPLTLLLLFVAYWRGRQLPLFAFGLIWYGVMVLPIWATRGFGYVGTSPRILYVAAGGAALIWAGLLTLDFRAPQTERIWKTALAVLMIVIVVQDFAFLNTRKQLHDATMPAIWDVVRSGQNAGQDAHLLYVNTPDQVTPRWREFPVGFFRAVLMPVSVDLGQYAELQTGIRPQTQSLSAPSFTHLEDYPYQVDMRGQPADQSQLSAAIRKADRVFAAQYEPSGQVHMVEAGNVTPAASGPYLAEFDGRLRLVQANVTLTGDHDQVTLDWLCLAPLDRNETVFVHVLDANGQVAAQADGDPLQGLYPLSECQTGEHIHDVRIIDAPAGALAVKAGVYNRASIQRLTAVDTQSRPLPENSVPIGQLTR